MKSHLFIFTFGMLLGCAVVIYGRPAKIVTKEVIVEVEKVKTNQEIVMVEKPNGEKITTTKIVTVSEKNSKQDKSSVQSSFKNWAIDLKTNGTFHDVSISKRLTETWSIIGGYNSYGIVSAGIRFEF